MHSYIVSFIILVFVVEVLNAARERGPRYDQNYDIKFGASNVMTYRQGREVQLSLTQDTASGIESKLSYGSGFFHLHIKLPGNDSGGVVTAFYMKSTTNDDGWILSSWVTARYSVQTNVFTNGIGGREHRIRQWFDPTTSFHNYRILWNKHQIVFFVDNDPICVFKNNRDNGVGYPDHPMQVLETIWNGDSWATDGGQTKVNWTHAPFKANFRSFGIYGCPSNSYCYSSDLWWNREQYWKLSQDQERRYQTVKEKYITYDYCSDRTRYPTLPPECLQ